jgi:hypothetical protein
MAIALSRHHSGAAGRLPGQPVVDVQFAAPSPLGLLKGG